MQHDLFGTLDYNDDESAWNVYRPLPLLAAYGRRPDEDDEDEDDGEDDDAGAALGGTPADVPSALKDGLRAQFGPDVDPFFQMMHAEMSKADDEDDDEFAPSAEQEAEFARREAKSNVDAERRTQGLFPVALSDPERGGPTPQQLDAFRHLTEREADVCRDVLAALYRSFQMYYEDEHWRKLCDLPEIAAPEDLSEVATLLQVDVVREHHDGSSYLVFVVDCEWEHEHGMYVVYHKTKGTDWTTADGLYDLIESDEPVEEDDPLPGNHELLAAVLAHNEKKVRELVAQGHDINDVGEEPFPPLSLAVEQRDVDLVKRLLALGADPNIKDFDRQTALKRAKRMLKEVTPRKGDKLTEAATNLARKADPSAFGDYKSKLEAIVRLLEGAGAK